MKKTFLILLIIVVSSLSASASSSKATADTISVRRAFADMPSAVLELLPRSTRLDMLDYYDVDSLWRAPNSMEGLSMLRKVTPDFIEVEVTPLSTVQIKVLPTKSGDVVAVCYTLETEGHAADTELRFFDASLKELPLAKIFRTPKLTDFFSIPKGADITVRDIETWVPFPTVKYTLQAEAPTLTATLTIESFMPQDTFGKLKPYLRGPLVYTWNKSKFIADSK